jgi:hypothetical protein
VHRSLKPPRARARNLALSTMNFRLPSRLRHRLALTLPGEAMVKAGGETSCRAGAEHLGAKFRLQPFQLGCRSCGSCSSMSRSWSCGCARKQQRLVASWSVRPFGSPQTSMRVDLLIDHQVLHSFLQRLEARTGGANPSDPRHSCELPRLVSGRSLQPCLLLIQLSDPED